MQGGPPHSVSKLNAFHLEKSISLTLLVDAASCWTLWTLRSIDAEFEEVSKLRARLSRTKRHLRRFLSSFVVIVDVDRTKDEEPSSCSSRFLPREKTPNL